MNASNPLTPRRAAEPVPPATPPAPFPSSPDLGEQLRRLGERQAEIDRAKVEELARLRAIQDRD